MLDATTVTVFNYLVSPAFKWSHVLSLQLSFLHLRTKYSSVLPGATDKLDLFWLHAFLEQHLEHFFNCEQKFLCVFSDRQNMVQIFKSAHILISEMEIMPVLPEMLKKMLETEMIWDEQDLLFKWKRFISDYMNSWQALPKLEERGGSPPILGISSQKDQPPGSMWMAPRTLTSVRSNGRKNPSHF